jgi:CDP-diacylglycerol--glycerol-3-phosphate 3-phosphatidyltransferase
MKLPLYLTLLRIVMGPLFLACYLYPASFGIGLQALPYVLLVILAVCEISDFFDGFVARKKNIVTDLGKVLDPMADSIFHLSIFFAFTQGVIQLPLFLVLFLFFREAILSTLRTLCALRGTALAARFSGKLKATLQAAAAFLIVLLLIPYSQGSLTLQVLQKISFYAVLTVTIYSWISAIEYIFTSWPCIKRTL